MDFICHFHFLRDIGKNLLEQDYDAIRQRLRQHALSEKLPHQSRQLNTTIDQQPGLAESFCQNVQAGYLPAERLERFPFLCAYRLIQWVLEGKAHGGSYGFPFDRPQVEFAKRLRIAAKELESIKDIHLRGQWRDNIPLFKLSCELKKVSAEEPLTNQEGRNGASEGIRTLDNHVGNVMLYQAELRSLPIGPCKTK